MAIGSKAAKNIKIWQYNLQNPNICENSIFAHSARKTLNVQSRNPPQISQYPTSDCERVDPQLLGHVHNFLVTSTTGARKNGHSTTGEHGLLLKLWCKSQKRTLSFIANHLDVLKDPKGIEQHAILEITICVFMHIESTNGFELHQTTKNATLAILIEKTTFILNTNAKWRDIKWQVELLMAGMQTHMHKYARPASMWSRTCTRTHPHVRSQNEHVTLPPCEYPKNK